MKKTLAALAVLGAFAGSAMAADVTLYGLVDLGLQYQYQKADGEDAVHTFKQTSGQNSGSRFGLKGTEDLGNGVKVGFVLENGFNADDGKMGQGSRLFGREANLYVTGDFGTLSMGRVGALSSGVGSYNVVYGNTVFGTGWGDMTGAKGLFYLGDRDRMDNTVTYVTPSFAGFKVYAQYSFNANGQEDAHTTNNQRYAGLGAKYDGGPFSAAFVIDTVKNKASSTNTEDSLGLSASASYDFNVAKVYGMVQYGKNENTLGFSISEFDVDGEIATGANEGLKGYAISLGATAPVLGGTVYAQVNYLDAETEADVDVTVTDQQYAGSAEAKRYGIAGGYSYPLSKRTTVYTYASLSQVKYDVTVSSADDSVSDEIGRASCRERV